MKQSILIVEDEPSIMTLLDYNLKKEGFSTDAAFNGEEAMRKIELNKYDLIVLDIMLPKMSGLEVCKQLRIQKNDVPILILTAKDSEKNRIEGLELGADDYLTKPFSPKELNARIRAILRRINRQQQVKGNDRINNKVIVIDDLEINESRFEVKFKGEKLTLTRKEYELLVYLAKHKGQVLSRKELLKEVWEYNFVGDTRIVDVHISRLRDKIETNKSRPIYIHTVRGFGYKMGDDL